jgi:hypothetical protein
VAEFGAAAMVAVVAGCGSIVRIGREAVDCGPEAEWRLVDAAVARPDIAKAPRA